MAACGRHIFMDAGCTACQTASLRDDLKQAQRAKQAQVRREAAAVRSQQAQAKAAHAKQARQAAAARTRAQQEEAQQAAKLRWSMYLQTPHGEAFVQWTREAERWQSRIDSFTTAWGAAWTEAAYDTIREAHAWAPPGQFASLEEINHRFGAKYGPGWVSIRQGRYRGRSNAAKGTYLLYDNPPTELLVNPSWTQADLGALAKAIEVFKSKAPQEYPAPDTFPALRIPPPLPSHSQLPEKVKAILAAVGASST